MVKPTTCPTCGAAVTGYSEENVTATLHPCGHTLPGARVRNGAESRYELALIDAAVAVEAHRDPNPINGDGKNHTLDLVLRDLDALAFSTKPSEAAAELRRTLQERRDARYREMHGIEAPRRDCPWTGCWVAMPHEHDSKGDRL